MRNFKKNQTVRVAKSENLPGCIKHSKGRFLDEGKTVEKCYDLKGIKKKLCGKTNRLVGDVRYCYKIKPQL